MFFVGDTRIPLIYEPGSPVKLAIQLPQNDDEREDPYLIEKHKIGPRQLELALPALCITNPIHMETVETILYGAGLFPIIIDDALFKIDSSTTFKGIQSDKMVREHNLHLDEMPLTMPVDSIGPIPFVDHKRNLIIPQACPPIWQWWMGGISPGSIVRCFKAILPEEVYEKLQKNHPIHQKITHSRNLRHNMSF